MAEISLLGKVQSLPNGFFDFKDIQWVEGSAKKSRVPYLEACIPSARVEDFIENLRIHGESVRGDTQFYVRNSRSVPEGRAVRIKLSSCSSVL